jgi:hypothetical protein
MSPFLKTEFYVTDVMLRATVLKTETVYCSGVNTPPPSPSLSGESEDSNSMDGPGNAGQHLQKDLQFEFYFNEKNLSIVKIQFYYKDRGNQSRYTW